jgi:hypothetical protein
MMEHKSFRRTSRLEDDDGCEEDKEEEEDEERDAFEEVFTGDAFSPPSCTFSLPLPTPAAALFRSCSRELLSCWKIK